MIGAKLRGEGPTTYEIEIRAKDGRPLLLDVSTRLILKDGQPVGVQGIARDVTERRRADRRLRESEERYRRLFDTSPLPIWVFDVNTLAFLAVNDAALSVYGYSKEEFMKLTLPELRLPEDRPALLEAVKEDASKEFFTRYSRHQRKNGTLMDMEIRAHQIEFAGQQARMVIAMDITERLRAEQAIRESEAKFRALTESSPYAILIARGNRVIFANRAAEDIIGYSATELTGRDPLSIIHPDHRDLAREKLAARAAGRMETMRYELKFLSRSGAERWLDMTTDVVVFEGAPAVLMNAVDVTERKIVEDQLRQAQKMEAVGRLAGGVAHDFNNLLMIIRGYADLIVDSGDLGEGAQRNAEQIIKAADRASGLTQQLLAFSRKQVLALQTLDLNLVLQGVDKMLHRLIGEDVELLIQSTPGLWPTKADPNQIEQVLLNLAINARDAMPRGGQLRIETRNVVLDEAFVRQHAGSSAGDFVQLEVSDTGVGMSPEVRARIFEPFFTTKEVGRGTGLGLATVYGIVKQSNGYITVESEADKGTTFRILLPRAAEVMARADQREVSGNLSGNETILLVEDQPDVRELARTFLGGRGYHVLEAQDGSEALRISGGHHGEIHLLVTDVVMPGMSGKELAEQMAPLRPSMKVLFVSGYTAEAIGQHGVLEPGTEFLQKPFSQEALARKLREILDATG
jgi:PAS domain S-box-containing protein